MAKPRQLFVAADGPRKNNVDDKITCERTRAIIKQVDWDCEVETLFREENLGCRRAVSSGINWFFNQVEEGIILEDDCLPHQDFFHFCQVLLETYRDNPDVMHISGDNFQFGQQRGSDSYYFSRISHIWGWATWRRAWQLYDVDMNDYPDFLRKNKVNSIFANKAIEKYWLFFFRRVYRKADTWDYQWAYAVMKNKGYCIIPNVNLISNIGFGEQATHAMKKNDPLANIPVSSLATITHPATILVNESADLYTITEVFPIPGFFTRAFRKIVKVLKQLTT